MNAVRARVAAGLLNETPVRRPPTSPRRHTADGPPTQPANDSPAVSAGQTTTGNAQQRCGRDAGTVRPCRARVDSRRRVEDESATDEGFATRDQRNYCEFEGFRRCVLIRNQQASVRVRPPAPEFLIEFRDPSFKDAASFNGGRRRSGNPPPVSACDPGLPNRPPNSRVSSPPITASRTTVRAAR